MTASLSSPSSNARCPALQFPRLFSRYSTLSEDRRLVQTPARDASDKPGDGSIDGESPLRYLALCRVIVNKVFVTSKDSDVRHPLHLPNAARPVLNVAYG